MQTRSVVHNEVLPMTRSSGNYCLFGQKICTASNAPQGWYWISAGHRPPGSSALRVSGAITTFSKCGSLPSSSLYPAPAVGRIRGPLCWLDLFMTGGTAAGGGAPQDMQTVLRRIFNFSVVLLLRVSCQERLYWEWGWWSFDYEFRR